MDESINGTLNQILDYIGGCEDFRNNAQLRTYLERLTKKEAPSSVSSSAGLEGLQVDDKMLQKAIIEAVRQGIFPKTVDLETYVDHWQGMKEVLRAALKAD